VGFAGHAAAPRWIGYVPYEAMRALERATSPRDDARPKPRLPTPHWNRYDAVIRVDHWTGEVAIEADTSAAAERLFRAASSARASAPEAVTLTPVDARSEGDHEARIAAALEYIARGDVYQVNLARRLRFSTRNRPLDIFRALFGKAPAPFGVCFEVNEDEAIIGTSPELALEVRGHVLRTAPIKGTRPRGACAQADRDELEDLEASDKERAELVMAVDLHRNDLGRVATFGSVRALGQPRTITSRTVSSRVHEVVARRDLSCDLSRIVSAMLPCGSVTGAPKVRAMEIIAELEPQRRGLYTGAVGYVGRDGGLVLAMAIRTAVVSRRDAVLEYFTGGGIVAGSDPRRELEETRWKARQLMEAHP
jgi:anthranilate/para-aminobenzoate synthase component I